VRDLRDAEEGKTGMPTTKDKRETRANLWEQMVAIMANPRGENGELSGEQAEEYDRIEADLDRLETEIEREDRHAARAKKNDTVDRRGVVPADELAEDEEEQAIYDRVFATFLRRGALDMTPEDRAVLQSKFEQDDRIRAAAGVGTGSAGGYVVPPAFRDKIVETMKWYGPMLDEAEVIYTATGANLPWPTNDDTGNMGAILGENTQVTEQDVTLGTASLDAYMYTSKLVRVSFQLLNDRPDFDTWLARKLGQRLGRIINNHATVGTGTSQPDGIVTSATVGVTGTGSLATTGGISYDNVVDLIESLDPAYGNASGGTGEAPGLKFMMHQSARKALRKLKDGQQRPLWEPSLQAGFPDSLMGYPTRINNDMATVAQNSKSLLFGNIREAYVIRIVQDIQSLRLTERYADFLQVGFLAFERADATMQDSNAVRVFQTTATA
jgi:HK97 family phage major capsid protein